jgi:iron complex transport system ATP-binding protein
LENAVPHIILQSKNLSIGYPNKKENLVIHSNLDITLNKGDFVCLLGNNGIGKSTLIRTLSRMQAPLSGQVLINNKDLKAYAPHELAQQISLVLTESIPQTNLTVYDIVALGRQPYTNWIGTLTAEDQAMVGAAMEQTQITKFAKKRLFELSDGQKQRVMIARALAQNTPIIFLDEPTAHLDIHYKVSILSLLKDICKTLQKSIIIATHEINFATQLANHLWLMFPDTFISGTTDSLIKNGSLEKLFKSDLVTFDAISKHFNIKNI